MQQKLCGLSMSIRKSTFEDLITPFSFPELRQKAKFAAIPSTSGTATEVTAFSVITDYAEQVSSIRWLTSTSPRMLQSLIRIWLAGLPVKQVAYTGMDALTHAIEAYVSTLNCPYTDPLALQGNRDGILIICRLPTDGNMEARAKMHYAQCLAGMAFSNASTWNRTFYGS